MTFLSIHDSPDHLRNIYDENFYWYLSSKEFHTTFLQPIGEIVNEKNLPCLDVGCGEGQLCQHVQTPYHGIDGSSTAIENAKKLFPHATFEVSRFEDFNSDKLHTYTKKFGTIVFGGVLEVLIKADRRVDFLNYYKKFNPQWFVVYDLLRLDTSGIDAAFEKVSEQQASVEMDILEVKKHRKILVYKCK